MLLKFAFNIWWVPILGLFIAVIGAVVGYFSLRDNRKAFGRILFYSEEQLKNTP